MSRKGQLFFSFKTVTRRHKFFLESFSSADYSYFPITGLICRFDPVNLPIVLNRQLYFKYFFNNKKIAIRYLSFFFERASTFSLSKNFLHSCRFRKNKDILLLKRYRSRRRFSNILHDSVFYSGLNLVPLFFTDTFREDTRSLHIIASRRLSNLASSYSPIGVSTISKFLIFFKVLKKIKFKKNLVERSFVIIK